MKTFGLVLALMLGAASAFAPFAARGFRSAVAVRAVGDKIPAINLDFEFPPTAVNMAARTAGKKTIIVGLPGAFTPTWSNTQVPGYLESQKALKAAGIDEVLVYCVNDGAVMKAWAANQGVEGSMITFLGDTRQEFTKAMKMSLTDPGPCGVLGQGRCKRYALYVVDGVVRYQAVSEAPGDPAGDEDPSKTLVDAMLKAIEQNKVDAGI